MPASAALSGDTRLILRNLAALGGLGVVISFWIIACTDWFPVVGGLLGLGGAFAWVAFVSGLLTKERKEQIQIEIERAVLLRPGLWKGVAATAVLFGIGISLFGTVELRSLGAREHRILQIGDAPDSGSVWVLPPFGKARKLVLTGWTGRKVRVRIEGFPTHTYAVRSVVPTRLTIPGSFERRTVALFRADADITESVQDQGRQWYFVTTLDGAVVGLLPEPFRGNTIWAGCHADVKLPDSLTEQWRRETPNLPPVWLTPLAVAEETSLEGAKEIKGWLLRNVDGLKPGAKESSSYFQPSNVVYSVSGDIPAGRNRVLVIVLTP